MSQPIVAVKSLSRLSEESEAPIPFLRESTWRVLNVARDASNIEAQLEGFGELEMQWVVPQAGNYRLEIMQPGLPVLTQTVVADKYGNLRYRLPFSGVVSKGTRMVVKRVVSG